MMRHQHMTNQRLRWILMEPQMELSFKKYQFQKPIKIMTEITNEIHIFMKMTVVIGLVMMKGDEMMVVTTIAIVTIEVIHRVIEIVAEMIIDRDILLIVIAMKAVWMLVGLEMIDMIRDIQQMVDTTV